MIKYNLYNRRLLWAVGYSPGWEVMPMDMYQTLSLMVMFGTLIVLIMSQKK
ncbi:putative holin-like toxin [Salibacterium sp. K-3]